MMGNLFRLCAVWLGGMFLAISAATAMSTIDLTVTSKITEVIVYPGAAG